MTFLQGLFVTLGISLGAMVLILWACLKVASDCDDAMDYEERENDESSKH